MAGALLVLVGAAAAIAIYAGLYNIAADVPYPQPVYWLYETIRDRSVAARARDIVVPTDLDESEPNLNRCGLVCGDVQGLSSCAGHATNGDQPRSISARAGTSAPNRSHSCRTVLDRQHGVKMSGMPAWGITHDDELLWDVVAFVRPLPKLTPEQYETLVKNAPIHEELMQEMETKQSGHHE